MVLFAVNEWDSFFNWLMDREGRIVTKDPRDPGGQTCWGISRKYHPNSRIWVLVDGGVKGSDLEPVVNQFYQDYLGEYWNFFGPKLREVFCDAFVNMGGGRAGDKNKDAVELLQMSVNCLLGRNELLVDGGFGNKTKSAVSSLSPSALAYTMCALRMTEYRRRKSSVYGDGWLNRVEHLITFISPK